mgnify:FL=1
MHNCNARQLTESRLKEEVAYKRSSRCEKISAGHAAVLISIILMASSQERLSSRFMVHHQMSFSSQEEKDTYLSRYNQVKKMVVPDGSFTKRSTINVMNSMMDHMLTVPTSPRTITTPPPQNEMLLETAGTVQ